ncbi:hypothetical protein [Actinomadura rudentiformis]|uniref:hypothetical protein n=1 Tax=Actinomadura rudentiformis TaxID=359158 RepID=UPI001CEF6FD9|nr:hypothetical protein [Actinomadura rudentiformis]
MRAGLKGVVALAAVTLTVAGAAGCSSSDDKGGGDPVKGTIVLTDNSAFADKLVKFKDAEYVKIAGLPDQAAAKTVNGALRGPLDWSVTWASATLLPEQRTECKGRSSVIQTKVRLGLRKGEIISAANNIQMIPCYEGEGALPNVPVTVDVKAGKALTAEDVFDSKTLEKKGLKKLWDALSGPKDDWKDCELDDIQKKDFSPGKRDGDPIESPAPAGVLFTEQGMELIWSTTGTSCNNFTFTAPYDKVKDMINKDLYPRLLAGAAAK